LAPLAHSGTMHKASNALLNLMNRPLYPGYNIPAEPYLKGLIATRMRREGGKMFGEAGALPGCAHKPGRQSTGRRL